MRFVETNIFLYVLTAHPEFGNTASGILHRIEKGEEAVTSSLVVAEVAAWLAFHKMKRSISTFVQMLESYPTLTKVDTTYEDELLAASLDSRYQHLEFFDRVYLAQMQRLGVTEIYSNDRGFDKVEAVTRVFK